MCSSGSATPVSKYLQNNFISDRDSESLAYNFNKFSFSWVKFVILLIELGVKCSKSKE